VVLAVRLVLVVLTVLAAPLPAAIAPAVIIARGAAVLRRPAAAPVQPVIIVRQVLARILARRVIIALEAMLPVMRLYVGLILIVRAAIARPPLARQTSRLVHLDQLLPTAVLLALPAFIIIVGYVLVVLPVIIAGMVLKLL
jgi:hypothetical protein